ncbi:MAG: hypothetical protein LIP28_00770, partial [Deltaproteobacteria bacterium]|nr:hypothetical protein [Deltaproteobacteria bacterium]
MAEEQHVNDIPETAGEADSNDGAPSGSKVDAKVELDLDDAPFLEDAEPEPEPEKAAEPAPVVASPARTEPASLKERLLADKKKLLFAGSAAVGLLVAAVAVNMFLFSGGDE